MDFDIKDYLDAKFEGVDKRFDVLDEKMRQREDKDEKQDEKIGDLEKNQNWVLAKTSVVASILGFIGGLFNPFNK